MRTILEVDGVDYLFFSLIFVLFYLSICPKVKAESVKLEDLINCCSQLKVGDLCDLNGLNWDYASLGAPEKSRPTL